MDFGWLHFDDSYGQSPYETGVVFGAGIFELQ